MRSVFSKSQDSKPPLPGSKAESIQPFPVAFPLPHFWNSACAVATVVIVMGALLHSLFRPGRSCVSLGVPTSPGEDLGPGEDPNQGPCPC